MRQLQLPTDFARKAPTTADASLAGACNRAMSSAQFLPAKHTPVGRGCRSMASGGSR